MKLATGIAALFTFGLLLAPSASAQDLTVRVAPPALKVEVKPAAPAPNFVWAPGHWTWSGTAYVWAPGVWIKPHPKHRHFVRARWVRRGDVWIYRSGGWAATPGGRVVVVHRHPVRAKPLKRAKVLKQERQVKKAKKAKKAKRAKKRKRVKRRRR